MRVLLKGRMFTPDGVIDEEVTVEDGVITRVGRGGPPPDRVLEYSWEGEIILPGLIDMHVHLRDFEQSQEEDFTSGTMAAAMGGYTVLVDMPNTTPPVNSIPVLMRRESTARGKALVDYGLYCGIPPHRGDLGDEVPRLALGFKLFMEKEFYSERKPEVLRALEFASRERLPVVVHAENPEFYSDAGMGPAGTPEAEASAILDISSLAEEIGFRLHVTHLSSAKGVRELTKWKERIKLSADTCPCYLFLTSEDVKRIGPVAKVHPPIKSRENRDVLIDALRSQVIDAVSSDHAPHLPEEKRDPVGASPGFPGLETTLPLILSMVNRGVIELEELVRVCATAPAEILGLKKLGSIEEGKIGNFTVVDLKRRWRIDPKAFASKAKYSPFEGFEVVGAPVATIVRGRLIMDRGKIVGEPGWGRNVTSFR